MRYIIKHLIFEYEYEEAICTLNKSFLFSKNCDNYIRGCKADFIVIYTMMLMKMVVLLGVDYVDIDLNSKIIMQFL